MDQDVSILSAGQALALRQALRDLTRLLIEEEKDLRLLRDKRQGKSRQDSLDRIRLERDLNPIAAAQAEGGTKGLAFEVSKSAAKKVTNELNHIFKNLQINVKLDSDQLTGTAEEIRASIQGLLEKLEERLREISPPRDPKEISPRKGHPPTDVIEPDPFGNLQAPNSPGSAELDNLFKTGTDGADALSATVNDITAAMAGVGGRTQARSGGSGAGDGLDGLTKMIETVRGSFAGLGDEAAMAGRDMAGAFEDAGIGAVDFSGLLGDIFDALGGIGGKAGELIGLFGNLFRGGGLGDLLGGLSGIFGFAGGGTLQPRLPAIVGERGPELFIPSGPGRIASGAEARGLLGGADVKVTQNITLATDVRNTVRAEIAHAAPLIADATRRGLIDDFVRRGIL